MKNGKPKLFSDDTTQTRNGVMPPFPHLLPYGVNALVRGNVEGDFISADQAPQRQCWLWLYEQER